MSIKGIIFDCDGVLLDSEAAYLEKTIANLSQAGYTASIDDIKYILGYPVKEIIQCLDRQFDLSKGTGVLNEEEIKYFVPYPDIDKIAPMEGVINFIKYCYSKKYSLAIASTSESWYVNKILDNYSIRKYFDVVVCGEQVENGKPSPDIYNLTAKRINIQKKDLIAIEDSVNGIISAKSSGIYTIGLKLSKIFQDTSNADYEAYSYKEIIDKFNL